jgi:2-succinyl-6-hydroxy-2,4-cyclohexadiene-1-carboxylate synthase
VRIALIHGFLGGGDAWGTIEGERVTLPGHGAEPVQATWGDNIAVVAKGIGEVDAVVGYSLGARVALALVAEGHAPRGVLISVNPGIDDELRDARRVTDAAWAAMLRARGIETFVPAWEAQPLFASQARVSEERRAARRTRRLRLDPEQLARSLEVMGLAEMPDYRGAIDKRIAMINGSEDTKYLAIAAGFDVHREIVADAGHDPTFEQPAACAQAIARCLSAAGR